MNKLPNAKRDTIIGAALELLQEQGLNDLSLRDIAKKLDIKAPALYWYFKSKSELVDYMAEAILQQEFKNLQPRRQDEPWQDWLIQHMEHLRNAMLAYPDGARVVAGAHLFPTITLGNSTEYSLQSLCSAGLDLRQAGVIVMTATNYTFGYVIEEQASPTTEELKHIDWVALGQIYPMMMRAVTELDWGSQAERDRDFRAGLERIIS